jgi:hypothetical protein
VRLAEIRDNTPPISWLIGGVLSQLAALRPDRQAAFATMLHA